jgi:glycosyltransferase involved in cell wall biosynthesis
MRVAHVITRMIVGGAQENTLFNCLDLLNDYRDDVLLITGPALGPEGRLLEQGRAGGLKVEVIDSMRRSIQPKRDWNAYSQLRKTIRRFQPDVVHTHSAKGGILGRAAAWNEKVPAIVHTVHGAPFHPYQSMITRSVYRVCERWAAKRCHHLIAVAEAMKQLLLDNQIMPASQISTIYSGMDVEPFVQCHPLRDGARRELGIPDGTVVVGKIARLFELKGHEYLIAAAPKIIEQQPNIRFLLVGDGLLRKQLERQIEEVGLLKYFIFTGLVAPESIPRYVAAMDMLVHCSLREGLARALPQALIAGKPVISFDVDGAREVCIDQETGILLPPKSISELSDAVVVLAKNSELRESWGRAGQGRFTEKFRHQTMTGSIRKLYETLLAGKGRGS